MEDKEVVKSRIDRALEVLKPKQVWLDPDCGLKTRTREESVGKLKSIVAAAEEARAELGKN